MRTTISTKLIIILLFLTIIPLVILGALAVKDEKKLGLYAVDEAKNMSQLAIQDSTNALLDLGETVVKNQAVATKQLVELYLKTHPDITAEELIADKDFQKIAIQPIGNKGYTTVVQTKTQNIIAHPNQSMMGKDLIENLKSNEKMQDWWRVVNVTWEENKDNSGYYKWPEADGTYSDKYMYLAVIDEKLTGEINLSVAATTYIDEFSSPIIKTEKNISESVNTMLVNIITSTDSLSTQNTILVITIITIFLTILAGILFSHSITKPIKQLTVAGNKISKGDIDVDIPEIKTNDEIKDLSESFKSAFAAIKFLIEKSNDDNIKKN